jgi:hypothetical protein
MKKLFASLAILFLVALPLAPAFAQEPSPDAGVVGADEGLVPGPDGALVPPVVNPDNPSEIWAFISRAFTGKQWGAFAAGILMFLVWGVKLFLPKIPKEHLPIVAAALGMVTSVAISLSLGWIWYKALINGLLIGGAAIGFWELLSKYILRNKTDEKKPVDPPK